MVTINNDALKEAVRQHEQPESNIGILAGSSPATLRSALEGDSTMNLSTLNKLAEFLGLEIQVTWKKVKKPAEVSA